MTDPSSHPWWHSELPPSATTDPRMHIARIPPGLGRKQPLFEALARELRLPGYCRHNWDALEEALRDFAWLGEIDTVWLVHADLPFSATSQNRGTYLAILRHCVEHGQSCGPVRLRCVFPTSPDEQGAERPD
jgi:hypothetical protein